MSDLATFLQEMPMPRRTDRVGPPAAVAGYLAPIDLLDDFTLDLDADAAIEACEALWRS